jgi:hypothetical protein
MSGLMSGMWKRSTAEMLGHSQATVAAALEDALRRAQRES